MPKAPASSSSSRQSGSEGKLLKLCYNDRRVVIPRPKSYKDAITATVKHFGRSSEDWTLKTKDLEICDGDLVEIHDDSWDIVREELRTIELFEATAPPLRWVTSIRTPTSRPTTPCSGDRLSIRVVGADGWEIFFKMRPSSSIKQLRRAIAAKIGKEVDDIVLRYDGSRLSDTDTFVNLGVENDDVIEWILDQIGGKPVIYLYAPKELRARVKLSLVPSWQFSALYPVVPVHSGEQGQSLEWDVSTREDGSLFDHDSKADIAYLYWEARTNFSTLPSPPPSPHIGVSSAYFDPLSADLANEDSVLLYVEKNLTGYLDKALQVLGLHVEARTSFITYWLPSFLKHKYVALRFVNQAAYECAAPLDIVPRPDVVTRVFMLFKGVSETNLSKWESASQRALEGVARWRDIVGVDLAKGNDKSLFRVLEWGGMEVLK
ncbi:hypothetical protein VKT23_016735 [Stygiomarasmius scandens]|uniref:Ubiquitin-like domain-containing protein n=1 Tax=Marasmiellus scandens TaxID=2682957 RepID=A0ABR1IWW3_9AGAR